MARNDMLRQLIASPHPLPAAQPRALTVAPQRPLPPQVRFGPASPPQLGRSGFSGALVGAPINVVHPEAPANYSSPTYSPVAAVRPVGPIAQALQPLVASLMATGATGGGGGGGTGGGGSGGIAAPPPPPPHQSFTLPAIPGVQYNAQGSTVGVPQKLPTVTSSGQVSSALIAALAQMGQRLGTSRTAATFY